MARTKKETKSEPKKVTKKKKVEEVQETVDVEEIKKELTIYIDKEIKRNFLNEIEKANKKVIREKNKKIFMKNIIILILIAVIGFLLYQLYNVNYFDKYFIHDNKTTNTELKETKSNDSKEKDPTKEEVKNKYKYLLDNISINEKSKYLDNYYNGDLTNELKCYLTLNSMDFNKLSLDKNYSVIKEDDFINYYNKLFDNDYSSTDFDYNGKKITYIPTLSSYVITNKLNKDKSNIVRVITDVKVNGDEITIKTLEAVVKDNQVYDVTSSTELGSYTNNLNKYSDKLNKVTYTFKDNKLINLK